MYKDGLLSSGIASFLRHFPFKHKNSKSGYLPRQARDKTMGKVGNRRCFCRAGCEQASIVLGCSRAEYYNEDVHDTTVSTYGVVDQDTVWWNSSKYVKEQLADEIKEKKNAMLKQTKRSRLGRGGSRSQSTAVLAPANISVQA